MSYKRLTSLGLAATVLALFVVAGFPRNAHTEEKQADHSEHLNAMMACAKACSDCQRICDRCSTHCARMVEEGKKEHFTTLMTCQDCATICAAASQIAARGGPYSGEVCKACAEVCGKCAAACEKFADDKHMKACTEECRKCEKACNDMVKHMSSK